MPQLMPLMWIMSTLIISFILMIMIDMYFYMMMDNLYVKLNNEIKIYKSYLW